MKVYLLIMLMVVSLISIMTVEAASSCTPRSGYDSCWSYSNVKIHSTDVYGWSYGGVRYIDESSTHYPIKTYCDGGDNTYFYKSNSKVSCSETGCSGATNTQGSGARTWDIAASAPLTQPAFVCYDSSSTSWAWVSVYWSATYKKVIKQCTTDSECGVSQFCDGTNPYEVQCANLNCAATQIVIDHKCVTPTFPVLCQNAGITDYVKCQSYLAANIDVLQGDLDSKVAQIGELQVDISAKAQLITKLTGDLAQQTNIINNLTTNLNERLAYIEILSKNLEDQSIMINGMENTIAEKAIYIKELQSNIDNQVYLINQLTSNLEEKALLVSQLTVENSIQAELIQKMEESFSRQSEIVKNLNLTVEEDARLISEMDLTVEQQADIINNLQLTLAEEVALIEKLNLKISDQEEIVARLSSNLEEAQKMAQLLKLDNEELKKAYDDYVNKTKQNQSIYLIIIVLLIASVVWMFLLRKKRRR